MSTHTPNRGRPAARFPWRVVLAVIGLLLTLCRSGTVVGAQPLNIAFISDFTGPGASYWLPARTAFERSFLSNLDGDSVRLVTLDAAGRASGALQSALRSVAVNQSRILVLGTSNEAAMVVAGRLASERVIVISLANFEDAELSELHERSRGRFFALSGLPMSYVDMVGKLMDLGIYDRQKIALWGDDDLVKSLLRKVGALRRADVLDRRAGFYELSKGDWPWNFVIAVSRFGVEFDEFLRIAERTGRDDRRFLGLSGPTPEFRGRVAARLLLSVVEGLHRNSELLDDTADLTNQLERTGLVDPATGSIIIPWDVTAYGLYKESYLIKEMLFYGGGRRDRPVELCQSGENSFVVRFSACFRD